MAPVSAQRTANRHVVVFVTQRGSVLLGAVEAAPTGFSDVAQAVIAQDFLRERSIVFERLERMGHITGYTIRRGNRGAEVQAYLLVSASGASHDSLAAALQTLPEVRVCDSVSGDLDLILQVHARDIAGIDRVRATVAALPGVARTRTALVMQNRFQRGDHL